MPAPQGLCFYSGVQDMISAQMTITCGVSPNVCEMVVPPQSSPIPASGTLVWSYGSTRIVFEDARLDTLQLDVDSEGHEIWRLHILDRRWRWRSRGAISGRYNVRRDSSQILSETAKSPRELASLCFEAMGEKRFLISGMPNVIAPEIDWDYELPSDALAQLADQTGTRVAPFFGGAFGLVPIGVGVPLPPDPIDGGLELDPKESPDNIVIVGGRIRYQHDFELEPVGIDLDGNIKRIEQLSYAPRIVFRGKAGRGWVYSDIEHFLDLEDPAARYLAQQTVMRWFRIKTPFSLPNVRDEITRLDRVLPLLGQQIELANVAFDGDRPEPREPWVYGSFYGGEEELADTVEKIDPDIADKPRGFYRGSFSVDAKQGIVKFSDPVYRLEETIDGAVIRNPVLRLRIACNLRDEQSDGWIRDTFYREPPKSKRKRAKSRGQHNRFVKRDDVQREIYIDSKGRLIDNQTEVEKQARYYWDAIVREYSLQESGSATYAGILPLLPDGAITQVTWSVDQAGFARTRVSRNREELHLTTSYKERRMFEQLLMDLERGRATEDDRRAERR